MRIRAALGRAVTYKLRMFELEQTDSYGDGALACGIGKRIKQAF